MFSKGFHTEVQELLEQLQLPILDLPLPASSSLTFLERLGVSTELNLPTLMKVLQQLSAAGQLAGSEPDLAAMRRLYQLVHAEALQDADAAAAVRNHFEQLPLVFVRAMQQRESPDGGSPAWQGFWVTCRDVMWRGSRRIFPPVTFIAPLYKVGHQTAGRIIAGHIRFSSTAGWHPASAHVSAVAVT